MSWLEAQGVTGFGRSSDKLSIFEADAGQRGIIAIQDIAEGEQLVRLPLRLALTDHPRDEESNRLVYEGAPWSVRLAAKLLREASKGEDSAWFPFIQALPTSINTPLDYEWEVLQQVEDPYMGQALDSAGWLTQDAYPRLDPHAIGNASREEFEWAHQVVLSRTFGSAGEDGGVGVRFLMPILDMLNHGGDQTPLLLSDPPMAMDDVRWNLVAPDSSGSEQDNWEIVLTANKAVQANDEVLLSYGERGNDEFFGGYGFVPPRNPHEEMVLFGDTVEALEWHHHYYPPPNAEESHSETSAKYETVLETVQDQEEAELKKLPASIKSEGFLQDRKRIRIGAADNLDGRLHAAYEGLARIEGRGMDHAFWAIMLRCLELLQERSPILTDLSMLADPARNPEPHEQAYWSTILQYYTNAIRWFDSSPFKAEQDEVLARRPQVERPEILGAEALPWSSQLSLVITFRTYKKMIAWDTVIALAAELNQVPLAPPR
ncbi:hypothetical protein WJX84_003298 [Apatococcus fuscideae]|uniref:SET domain-containing protein n=1 Tax=Apatococcus fuscideae TaxID=2026836 RepID=A0AAW1TCP2_9CHLO